MTETSRNGSPSPDLVTASVAICTWNRSALLRRTLDQLTQLVVPPGVTWELLIVNNCCTDDTDIVVRSFEGRLPVRLLHEANAGLSYARNRAIAEARGTYLLWTDDDVLPDRRWMKVLLDGFAEFGADWVFGPSDPEWPGATPDWYTPQFRNYFAVLNYGPDPFVVKDRSHPFYGLNFGGLRRAHAQLGGFRVEYGPHGNVGGIGDDIDMFERAMRVGMRVVYLPHAHVRHLISPARTTRGYHRRQNWAGIRTYYRHLPELFPAVPWLLGMPRFFFSKAVDDVREYVRTFATGDRSARFRREVQLLRFAGLLKEAAVHGFRRP